MIFKDKKAFGGVVSTLIMFISVILVTTGLVVVFQNHVTVTQTSLEKKTEFTSNKLRTQINVINTYYNSTAKSSFYYVKNAGETSLHTDFFNLFINGIIRNPDNYSIRYADNFSKNMTLFQPQDTMVIISNQTLGTGTNKVRIITEFGVGDEISFII